MFRAGSQSIRPDPTPKEGKLKLSVSFLTLKKGRKLTLHFRVRSSSFGFESEPNENEPCMHSNESTERTRQFSERTENELQKNQNERKRTPIRSFVYTSTLKFTHTGEGLGPF